MRKFTIVLLLVSLCATVCRADEGMWLPSLIGKNIKDMRSKGFKLSADDIYNINKASLKDAVMKFGSGCSAELISGQGLILTNHHCGYGEIQKHSSLEHDYLTNGFWAMNRGEELPNPGLTVTFLVRMDDVTEAVTRGVDRKADPAVQNAIMKGNKAKLVKNATEGTHYKADVESFYYGNQYFLFIYEVFEDVRLVGAPPSAIGKFGGDTDNWMWPRHTGDFSLFRIYAGTDNKPAKYSKDNVPYRPKKYFEINTAGVKEGDFTFIYGLPARTTEYITSDAVDYVLNVSNPIKIALRTMRLDEIKRASAADPAVRIQYAAKAASIANGWKKWQGESLGLARLKTIERKKAEEAAFEKWAALPGSDPTGEGYAQVLPELRALYAELKEISRVRDYYMEAYGAVELTKFAATIASGKATKTTLADYFKDYSPEIDRNTAVMMLREYVANVPSQYVPSIAKEMIYSMGLEAAVDELFKYSNLASVEKYNALGDDAKQDLIENRPGSEDMAVEVSREFTRIFNQIEPRYKELSDRISLLYTVYMKGLMAQQPNRNFYPDANFTLRIAYGKVAGYKPEDGMLALPNTTLEGIMQKDNPNIYDYDVPARLREVYAAKDYGRWASDGTVPVAFIATNHTSGGNSGSPVLNGRGELVGLNFDRTWLSTMSDIEFDPTVCRNISADIRYVLFVIEKVGGAGYLFDEMTFIKK